MRDKRSVAEDCGYVITDAGRAGLADSNLCACRVELVGKTLQCGKCLTIYGFIPRVPPRRIPFDWKPS